MDEIKNETVDTVETETMENTNVMVTSSDSPAVVPETENESSNDTLSTVIGVAFGALATYGAVRLVTDVPKACKWVGKKVGGFVESFRKPKDPKEPIEAEFKEVDNEKAVESEKPKKEEPVAEEKK